MARHVQVRLLHLIPFLYLSFLHLFVTTLSIHFEGSCAHGNAHSSYERLVRCVCLGVEVIKKTDLITGEPSSNYHRWICPQLLSKTCSNV